MGLGRWLRGAGAFEPRTLGGAWARMRERTSLLDGIEPADEERLRSLALAFGRSKSFEPAGGLVLSPDMCASIAIQAVLPVLNLGLDWYRGWISIIVYREEFLSRQEHVDDAGVVHQIEELRVGEAWDQGPVLLAWPEVEACLDDESLGNVVIHELAHKLDLLNGVANGMPPLHPTMEPAQWSAALRPAYDTLRHRTARGLASPLEESAAEDPAEFFAVISESFFVDPGLLARRHPAVYAQLRAFYRQDPASRR